MATPLLISTTDTHTHTHTHLLSTSQTNLFNKQGNQGLLTRHSFPLIISARISANAGIKAIFLTQVTP